jgi:hypothetical protein
MQAIPQDQPILSVSSFFSAEFLYALVLLTGLLSGCDGSSSPTEPTTLLSIDQAQVSLNQNVVNGMTLTPGQAQGGSTLFHATLLNGTSPAPGETMWIDLERPAGMPMMGQRFRLLDDGQGCDPVAFDGEYCHEDFTGHYGFHHGEARHGQYHYDFFAEHHDGSESNHVRVTVSIAGQ